MDNIYHLKSSKIFRVMVRSQIHPGFDSTS